MRLRKVTDLFITLVLGILFLTGVVSVMSVFGASFPEWTGVNKTYSELEGRPRQALPEMSLNSVVTGDYQSSFEKSVSDHVPLRNAILLANASIQRGEILIANTVFQWPAYPTKLGSGYAVINNGNAIVATAKKPVKNDRSAARSWAESIRETTEAYPNVRFVYDLLDDTYSSMMNPTNALVSGAYDPEWPEKNIVSHLGNRVAVIIDPIESLSELLEAWFVTEHHWKPERALQSYNAMGSYLDWIHFDYEKPVLLEECWYGSSARSGLDLEVFDEFEDALADFSNLSCRVNGEECDRGLRESYMRGELPKQSRPVFNYYHNWFGACAAEVIYDNPLGNGRVCLFVEQSYGVAIERYIAMNYSRLICVDPQNCIVDKSLSELIEEFGVDDVVIQYGYAYLTRARDRSPKFFT